MADRLAIAWGWLVTSASTLSIGRDVRLVVARMTCSECRAVVALETSWTSCAAWGVGAPDVAAGVDVAEAPGVWDPELWAVDDLCPQPAITVANSAATTTNAIEVGRGGRWIPRRNEMCAWCVMPFIGSDFLCGPLGEKRSK